MKHVLYVDDLEQDIELVRAVGRLARVSFSLQTCRSGHEALQTLARSDGSLSPAPAPDFILLDLKMPGMDGFQVLQSIRAQPRWAQLPVAVFTSSSLNEDIIRAFAMGASYFFYKPVDAVGLRELLWELDKALATGETGRLEALSTREGAY